MMQLLPAAPQLLRHPLRRDLPDGGLRPAAAHQAAAARWWAWGRRLIVGYVFHLLLEEYFIDTSTALWVWGARVICRKLESDVMQKDREIRSQYMDFTAKLRTDRTVHSMDCTGERNPNPLLASYVEFLKKDSEKRRVEEEELQGVLDGMKGQFDLAGWLRQVRRVATERDQRLANM